ncbi:RNA polymerase sigma-70 factor [Parabacteroides timonensis]|uniref:RNA polymerase sigma-70 factor n=1 Tax=Parabacteroides timonensis TaxID=1871013 RepID=UPI00094F2E2A|nr:RNA polymerase sigma-70 factor [Parabacteroides timonensis]
MADFTDEKTLLQEIKNGNDQAFEFLFRSYYPRLRGYASRFVKDQEAIRDIIQESFLKFWEKRQLIEAISVSSLLFAMVRNACLNYLKHIQIVEQHNVEYLATLPGKEELYSLDFNLTPECTLLYKELQEQVDTVVNTLPPRCREVFIMSRFDKKKNREIAETLGISTTAVEKHIAKALMTFSKYFKDKYPLDIYIVVIAWLLSD